MCLKTSYDFHSKVVVYPVCLSFSLEGVMLKQIDGILMKLSEKHLCIVTDLKNSIKIP